MKLSEEHMAGGWAAGAEAWGRIWNTRPLMKGVFRDVGVG